MTIETNMYTIYMKLLHDIFIDFFNFGLANDDKDNLLTEITEFTSCHQLAMC